MFILKTHEDYCRLFFILLTGQDPNEEIPSEREKAIREMIRKVEISRAKKAFESILNGYAK